MGPGGWAVDGDGGTAGVPGREGPEEWGNVELGSECRWNRPSGVGEKRGLWDPKKIRKFLFKFWEGDSSRRNG